ncbi:hypothetical protein [Chitinophaga rhizosphaerae]|uniref:hypothetical protein n=1 Tax=Chitinophaga rhizosphaerae TaxID=1864947 RepID=UPI0013DFBC64|nr:hypothetical protein [Chitinophaga rhizosphaerae]
MQPLTDPAFLRCKYTSYLLMAGTFLLVMLFLLNTGIIGQTAPSGQPATAVSAHQSR